MNKIGIMGGTFNPIHHGHLFLAENAFEQIGLDKILFMPSKNPPHKTILYNINEQQRVDMIRLAIQDNPHFELSTLELNREGFTYTADTLTLLTQQNPSISYYFIVGTDSLFMMQDWMEPQIIFDHCTIIVAGRDHTDEELIHAHIEYLNRSFHAKIIYLTMPSIQISSNDIRNRLAAKKSVRYYLPSTVIDYIDSNNLYQTFREVNA